MPMLRITLTGKKLKQLKYIVRYKYDCIAVVSNDIIPKTRESTFTKEQINTILKYNGIDAVLIFSIKDTGYVNESITVHQPYRTYINSKTYLLADVDILDVKTGVKIWTAQFDAGASSFSTQKDALIKTIKEAVKKMGKDGIVRITTNESKNR